MNDPIYVDFTDASETEVELSAQDLLDLPAPVSETASPAVATVEAKMTQALAARPRFRRELAAGSRICTPTRGVQIRSAERRRQAGETPADSTRTALISPSIRLPCLKDAAAAETPSGAASSMPRPLTSAP